MRMCPFWLLNDRLLLTSSNILFANYTSSSFEMNWFNNYYDIMLHNWIELVLWWIIIVVQMASGAYEINPVWIVFVASIGFYMSATFVIAAAAGVT